jgi:dTDP-glucose 4,6-dehydratase
MKQTEPGNILVTGGAGFIGSHFIRYILKKTDFSGSVINLDKLTYAGNMANLSDIEGSFGGKRYHFEHGDICDIQVIERICDQYDVRAVVHLAAESHVDRSIFGPADFIHANITGTFNLLEVVRKLQDQNRRIRFHHVSTDEVFGSLGSTGKFSETSSYDPRSPYSASKASADHLVRAYFHTYGLPVTISNCSNNYGPFQFPEKLIPLMILNALKGESLPVYGDGKNVRDWIFVGEHCRALWMILNQGVPGETYNVGGGDEKTNLDVIHMICDRLDRESPDCLKIKGISSHRELIRFVPDRPGHDRRYAINWNKIKNEMGWEPEVSFEEGLAETIQWYIENTRWVKDIQSGEYRNWLKKNYQNRP